MKRIIATISAALMVLSVLAGCDAPADEPDADTATVRSTSSAADTYASWLNTRLTEDGAAVSGDIIICDNGTASDYGVSLDGFIAGGYVIRSEGDDVVIAGKDNAGLDAAVRYFANHCEGGGSVNVTENEGYRVKSLTLGGTDVSDYTIFVDSTSQNAAYAAQVLRDHIADATGVSLSIASAPSAHTITIANDSALGEEAFTIAVTDGQVSITGGNARGALYGAYGFLENILGYRFYPRGVKYLYESDGIDIPSGYTHTEGLNTPFAYRDVYTQIDGKNHLYPAGGFNADYKESVIANHVNGPWTHKGWMNKEKYGYSFGPDANHSSYRLIPSVPDLEAPCFSDPDVYDECIANLRTYIDGLLASGLELGKTMPMISISQNDTSKWCSCPDCSALIKKYKAPMATLIDFISRISEELEEEYPGIEFWTLSYLVTEQPPVKMEIPDNLYICFCQYLACNNHPVDGSECDAKSRGYHNIDQAKNFEGWLELTDNIHVWYYANHFNYSIAPSAIFRQLYSDVRFYAAHNVKGMFIQNEETTLGFDDLMSYVYAKLLWNPDMTWDEYDGLIKEFCQVWYGDAWQNVYDYIFFLEDAADMQGCWSALGDAPYYMYDYNYIEENFEYNVELFEQAIKYARTAEEEARLKRLSLNMYFNGLAASYEDLYVYGNDEQKAHYAELYTRMYNRFDEIRSTVMLGIFQPDNVPAVCDPTVSPLSWYVNANPVYRKYPN